MRHVGRDKEIVSRASIDVLFKVFTKIHSDMTTENVGPCFRFTMVMRWPEFIGNASDVAHP
jgi:hypothetical protein